jgi:hypothetical protein
VLISTVSATCNGGEMSFSKTREQRIRWLVRTLNKARKQQGKKIDILCNDFIAAQRSFIKKLDMIASAADFYESIVGITELQELLDKAKNYIQNVTTGSCIVFFFRNEGGFEKHIFECDADSTIESRQFIDSITDEAASNICTLNKVCSIEELLTLGLQSNPKILNKLSVATIPLRQMGSSIGFILLYRFGNNRISSTTIDHVSSIVSGLSKAIKSCQMLQP